MSLLRKYWKRIVVVIIAVFVVAIAAFVGWAATPAGETMPTALAALESTEDVTVSRDDWIVFAPVNNTPTTGFIFYPGGRVLADSYAPLGQAVANAGHLAVFVPMPLNLAVFNVDGADAVIDAYPDINHWAIGGHSLGGAMAARYAYYHPDVINGLVLMASFPEDQFDFSEREIAIASIYGELDGLATVEEVEASAQLFPDDAELIRIEGGNHAQFGWYGAQAGDNNATISRDEQYKQIIAGTLELLELISERIQSG